MSNIMKSNANAHTAVFANNYASEGRDGYGNYVVYATVYMDDNKDSTVKLAIADDQRDGSKRGTELAEQIKRADCIQGKRIAISNAYTKASSTGATFLNAGKGAKVTWLDDPAPQAVAEPGVVAVAAHTRRAPKRK